MWGNRLGWSISAVLVLATVGFVVWLNHWASVTSPRTALSLDASNSAPIALPIAPNTVVHSMTQSDDAGPIYRRAIEEYRKDPFTYGRFVRSGNERMIDSVPAIRILIEASSRRSANIFRSHPEDLVTLTREKTSLEALETLGRAAARAGQLMEKTSPQEAVQLYEAVFALGARLTEEHVTLAELNVGLNLLAQGSSLIGGANSARADAALRFDQARQDYFKQRVAPMAQSLTSIDSRTLEKHAGDAIYLAEYAEERMWRIEAIFALARYRFNAARPGDARTALRVIKRLTDDSDPVIRLAAAEARDLTIEEYRTLK